MESISVGVIFFFLLLHCFDLEVGLNCAEENIGQPVAGHRTALNVILEGVLVLNLVSLLVGDTQVLLRFVLHVLVAQVGLQAYEDAGAVRWSQSDQLIAPLGVGTLETLFINQAEADQEAICVRIRKGSESSEILLTGSVPNLQLDRLAVNLVVANLEVNTDGGHEVVSEDIIL